MNVYVLVTLTMDDNDVQNLIDHLVEWTPKTKLTVMVDNKIEVAYDEEETP